MQDPQSMPGTFCPLNKFGLTDYDRLSLLEASLVHKRQIQLEEQPMVGNFTLGHFRKIHWFLFRDIFPWAGELRVVDMSKAGGTAFARPELIVPTLTDTFEQLKRESFLAGATREEFAERAGYYLGVINAIHAFREGNGRTQREFLRQLGLHCGWMLVWAGISKQENTAASVLSHTRRDNSGLVRILQQAIVGEVPKVTA